KPSLQHRSHDPSERVGDRRQPPEIDARTRHRQHHRAHSIGAGEARPDHELVLVEAEAAVTAAPQRLDGLGRQLLPQPDRPVADAREAHAVVIEHADTLDLAKGAAHERRERAPEIIALEQALEWRAPIWRAEQLDLGLAAPVHRGAPEGRNRSSSRSLKSSCVTPKRSAKLNLASSLRQLSPERPLKVSGTPRPSRAMAVNTGSLPLVAIFLMSASLRMPGRSRLLN